MRIIIVKGIKYLIRGNWTARQLKTQYTIYTQRGNTTMSFTEWLVYAGKVYFKIN